MGVSAKDTLRILSATDAFHVTQSRRLLRVSTMFLEVRRHNVELGPRASAATRFTYASTETIR